MVDVNLLLEPTCGDGAAAGGGAAGVDVVGWARGLGDDDLAGVLAEASAAVAAVQARMGLALAVFVEGGGHARSGVATVGQWGSINLGSSARQTDALAASGAAALEHEVLREAWLSGELSSEKARIVARVATAESVGRWVAMALEASVSQLARIASTFRRSTAEPPPKDLRDRSGSVGLWWEDQPDGLVKLIALLEPDDAALVRAALESMLEQQWRDGSTTVGPDADSGADAGDADATATAFPDADSDAGQGAGTDTAAATAAPDGSTPRSTGDGGPTSAGSGPQPDRAQSPGAPATDVESSRASADSEPPAGSDAEPDQLPAVPGQGVRGPQRRAEALVALAESGLASGPVPMVGAERTVVHLGVDIGYLTGHADAGQCHLHDAGSIDLAAARMLACDARIRAFLRGADGRVTDEGREQRLVTTHQRRLLQHRDGGCAFPGCTNGRFVDAHHAVGWYDGGRTDLDNLVLLCRRHHRAQHRGAFSVQALGDGRFRFLDEWGRDLGPPRQPGHPTPLPAQANTTTRARSGGDPRYSLDLAVTALAGTQAS